MSRDYITMKKKVRKTLAEARLHLDRLLIHKGRLERNILLAAKQNNDPQATSLSIKLKNTNTLIVRYNDAIARELRYLALVEKKINNQE